MNSVFFGNEGMTSTTANFYANIAKELQEAAAERLNSVKFFNTSVAVIGSSEKQLMSIGTKDLGFINLSLEELASLNAFCAWVREAIKAKEKMQTKVNDRNIRDWATDNDIVYPECVRSPKDPTLVTEQDIINSWSADKRNKYLKLEAFAATYGKYIHPNGNYSTARKEAHNAINTPITKQGSGRDTILYYYEPSVSIQDVDSVFLQLQNQYREYEKQLNQMKAELKEECNVRNTMAFTDYQKEYSDWEVAYSKYTSDLAKVQNKFADWKRCELEKIANLKIVIPNDLKPVFKIILEATSK